MTKRTTKYPWGQVIFRKLGIATLIFIYLLILAGGIVRSTGSGMGCPDWPKCFGAWIPPTEASALPVDYKDIYANKRKEKNVRLAGYLDYWGFTQLSKKMRNDTSMYYEADFNVYKTWVEYINRLIGVLVGFLILFSLVFSFSYLKQDILIPILSFISLVLVGFQAWIGSLVVSTNLLGGMITFHMMLAVLLVFVVIYTVARSFPILPQVSKLHQLKQLNWVLGVAILLSVIQVVLGTQVRESIDVVAKVLGDSQRAKWIDELGLTFYIHRSFSLLVLFVHGFLIYLLRKNTQSSIIYKNTVALFGILVLELMSGVMMAYFAIPSFLQPVHLVLAVVALGLQFYTFLLLNQTSLFPKQNPTEEKQYAYDY